MKIFITALVVASAIALHLNTTHGGEKLENGFSVGIGYSHQEMSVGNLPLAFRSVPAHHDDGGGSTIPVGRRDYTMAKGLEMNVAYNWHGTILGRNDGSGGLRTHLSAGLKWMPINAYPVDKDESQYIGRRPGSSTGGRGTALTFLGVGRYGPLPSSESPIGDMFLAWTPAVRFDIGGSTGLLRNYAFGAEVSYWQFRAVNGWDREDALETQDARTLAHVVPLRPYVQYGRKYWFIRLGPQFHFASKTSFGNKTDTRITPAGFFFEGGSRF